MGWGRRGAMSLVLLLVGVGIVSRESTPVFAQVPACGSVTDGLPRALPALAPPARGQSYVDPTFGCTVTRLTNAAAEGVAWVEHFYSSVNPFNAGSTLVLLQKAGGVQHIRDLSGNIVRDDLWRFGMQPLSDVVWSRTDPNGLYFHPVGGNELRRYDVTTDTMTVLHTFAGYASVWFGHWEGDLSWDGDHLPVVGDDRWGFIYTISTGAVTAAADLLAVTGGVAVDVFDLAPSNRAVLRWGNLNGGVAYFDGAMTFLGKVTAYAGHSDRARDADGADLEVAVNAADLTPLPGCTNAIVKVRLADRTQTCLRSMDWSLAQHVSCNNIGQGWCLVSTYNGVPGAVGYANELLQVKLDGSQTVRLAHSRSTNAGYDHYPRAAVSGDGRYVLFDSDMQGTVVDVYLLHNPDIVPPTVSITAPASGATVAGTITVSANATDNVGVAGVQFKLDGANLGPVLTVAPYSTSWNTTTAVNGGHTLTAVAWDAAGNVATSAGVVVIVNNPDIVPPTVSITAPASGATVAGTIVVAASASDNVGVQAVQFKLDGANLGPAVTVAPYSTSWNTTTAVNGGHTLTAVAWDAAGNVATSAGVVVIVNNPDIVPPTVSITAPASGSPVTGTITVSANATDNVGVVGVQFKLDGANLGAEVAVPPYAVSWNTATATNGTHTLTAAARDAAGNIGTAAVSVTVASGGTTINTGLVGYWKFDDGTGTTAADSSGNGNTGTLVNGPTWTVGKLGQALAFDGLSNYVTVPSTAALNVYPLTVAVWMKTSSTTGVRGIVNKYVAGSYNGYQVFMNSGNLCAWYLRDSTDYVYDGGGCPFNVPGYNDNQWHHVAYVVDASGGKLYVDGVQKGSLPWTGTAGAPTTVQPVHIAHYPGAFGGAEYLPGVLDDVRIYNRALSAADVLSLYNGIAP